jgi:uncharacterized BrkB/YihY/UPF0761 family membrane protein
MRSPNRAAALSHYVLFALFPTMPGPDRDPQAAPRELMSGSWRSWGVAPTSRTSATTTPPAGVILLLLWLYVTGIVLLVAAEINSEVSRSVRS